MRSTCVISTICFFLAGVAALAGHRFPSQPDEQVVPDELLIRLAPGAPESLLNKLIPGGARFSKFNQKTQHYRVQLPPGLENEIAEKLAADPQIEYVEPNRLREVLALPNDPSYASAWALTAVNAPKAWSLAVGRFPTASNPLPWRPLIGVVDTGVDCTHPDFANAGGTSTNAANGGQLAAAKSSALIATTASPAACAWQDDHGHGTHVTGILAAATSNGVGVSGLAYGAAVAIYKAANSSGLAADSAISQAIMAAADAGAAVISVSLGHNGYSQSLQDAINYAWQRNALVVASAGDANSATSYFPASAAHVLSVAAVDNTNTKASFSNYGNFISIAAPGVSIYSTVPTYTNATGATNYGTLKGTSMAAPHVSGTAGLIVTAYPRASATALAARIQQSAASTQAGGAWGQTLGYGVVDAGAAVSGTLRPATAGSVTGQIVGATNTPISGAYVSAGGVAFTTGTDGLYRLANLPAGVQQVTVSATGYSIKNFSITVPAGADVVVPVRMDATLGSYTGSVTSASGPVAGAVVEAVSGGLVQAAVITAADGAFTFPVIAGTYDLRASALGYVAQTSTAIAAGTTGPASANFRLAQLGAVSGAVMNASGSPVANAQVVFSNSTFVGGAATDASGNYSTLGLPAGTYTAIAQAPGFADATGSSVTVANDRTATASFTFAAGIASVTTSVASVIGGNSATGTVTLNSAAPTGGAAVALSSSSAAAKVPTSVTVPAGATTATFTITTTPVATSSTAVISASWSGSTQTASLTVAAASLSKIALSPTTVGAGASSTGTVTLDGAAPTGGAAIALSDDSTGTTAPASVVVPAGATTATFSITTSSSAAPGLVTVTGSYRGTAKTATFTISALSVSNFTFSPTSLVAGAKSTGTLTLNGPAPTGGAVIDLASSSGSASVPASVTIAAGTTSTTFSVTTNSVATSTVATLTASYGGSTRTASLTVNPLALSSLAVVASITGGLSSTSNSVILNGVAPAGGTVVALSSSTSLATVPATVTVPAGASRVSFTLAAPQSVTAIVTATITATLGAVVQKDSVDILPAAVSSITAPTAPLIGGLASTGTVTLTGPAPTTGLTVALDSSSASVTVPATITVAAGTTSVKYSISTVYVPVSTAVTITATYGSVSKTAGMTVIPVVASALSMSATSVVGATAAITGKVTLTGPAPAGGAAVTVTSSDPSVIVPATATVAAGATTGQFTVTTRAVAAPVSAIITATFTAVAKTATLGVDPPVASFITLSPDTVNGGSSATATVYLNGPAPSGGAVATLSSSKACATVPANVAIPAGAMSANVAIATTSVSADATATISATYGATATVALNLAAAKKLPTWPAAETTLDRFGGDTRVTSAVPAKSATYQGTVTSVTATTLTDSSASFPTDGSLKGKYLNPDINRGDSGDSSYNERWFRIQSNTATTVTVDPVDGSLLSMGAPPHAGSTYQIMSPFSAEKVGNRWWMIDPAGHGFFAKSVSKVSDIDSFNTATRYSAVYLQTSAGAFSSNLSAAAEDTHPGDVVNSTGVTVARVGDAIYIGSLKPFNVSGFYMTQLGVGGRVQWYYSTGVSWNPINGTGNPINADALNADGSFNFDVGNFNANGLGGAAANGNAINWWALQGAATSIFPTDFAPATLAADSTPRYYIKGVVTTAFTVSPKLGRVFDTPSLSDASLMKYGNAGTTGAWFQTINQRWDNWGFNSMGQYSFRYQTVDGEFPTTRKPIEIGLQLSGPTMLAKNSYYIKSVYDGAKCSPTGALMYQGLSPDSFDPAYALAVQDLASQSVRNASGPYTTFINTDDGDYQFAYNDPSHSHGGYAILSLNPYRAASAASGKIPGIAYTDPKFYSKYALRDFLRYRYRDASDTIAAFTIKSAVPAYTYSATPSGLELKALQNLNQAWGTAYTTWGTQSGDLNAGTNAYATGSGFMDENGRGIFPSTVACSLVTGANFQKSGFPSVRTDLDDFIAVYAAKTTSTIYTAVKKYTNNLISIPVYHPTAAIAKAIGPYVDVLWYKPYDAADAKTVYDNLGKPVIIVDYLSAENDSPDGFAGTITTIAYDAARNRTVIDYVGQPYNLMLNAAVQFPDSSCSGVMYLYPTVQAAEWTRLEVNGNYTVCVRPGQSLGAYRAGSQSADQGSRADALKNFIGFNTQTPGSDGAYFTVGFEHWSFADDAPLGWEWGQFGLVTGNDNAYDGYEATRQVGKDANGRCVGGEDYDYGNLLVPLSQYLHSLYSAMIGS